MRRSRSRRRVAWFDILYWCSGWSNLSLWLSCCCRGTAAMAIGGTATRLTLCRWAKAAIVFFFERVVHLLLVLFIVCIDLHPLPRQWISTLLLSTSHHWARLFCSSGYDTKIDRKGIVTAMMYRKSQNLPPTTLQVPLTWGLWGGSHALIDGWRCYDRCCVAF